MTKKMVKNSQINDQNEIQLNSMEKKMIFWKPSKAQGIEYAWIPRREGSRESTQGGVGVRLPSPKKGHQNEVKREPAFPNLL